MIQIKNHKIELLIDEILKRTQYSSPTEYLEDRIRSDFEKVCKNKNLSQGYKLITFKELRKKLSEVEIIDHGYADSLEEWILLDENSTFYIYRTDTNAVLARGLSFEGAKTRASQLRKSLGLKFDDIKFKSERSRANGTNGVNSGGKSFTNNKGERYPVEYSRTYNPSKRGRFRGYYDKNNEFHDID